MDILTEKYIYEVQNNGEEPSNEALLDYVEHAEYVTAARLLPNGNINVDVQSGEAFRIQSTFEFLRLSIQKVSGSIVYDGKNLSHGMHVKRLPHRVSETLAIYHVHVDNLKDVVSVGNISMNDSTINTLEGFPEVAGNIILSDLYNIKTLKGLPRSVYGELMLSIDSLETYADLPTRAEDCRISIDSADVDKCIALINTIPPIKCIHLRLNITPKSAGHGLENDDPYPKFNQSVVAEIVRHLRRKCFGDYVSGTIVITSSGWNRHVEITDMTPYTKRYQEAQKQSIDDYGNDLDI